MKLNMQRFGSRGASSSNNSISSFESLVNKRENMKYSISFGTGIDVSERLNNNMTSRTSYKIKDLDRVMANIDETVVEVQQGSADKRIKQLNNVGFKVISKTKPDDNSKTSIVLVHIKRRR